MASDDFDVHFSVYLQNKTDKQNKNNLYWKGEGGVKINLMNLII